MDFLIKVVLPLGLAFIMFSLGLGLTVADFKRVLTRPKAFLVGAVCQIIVVPAIAYVIAISFGLAPALAVGLMILSFCPGGVTSNLLSKLAKGDVALSVSLTGVVSIASMVTVPFLVAWTVNHFMGAEAPPVSISGLAISMFLITALPVALGVTLRHFAGGFSERAEPVVSMIAVGLFILIVIAALAGSWGLFMEQLPILGPSVILLNAVLILLSIAIASASGMGPREVRTIAVEAGVQNSTVGIALAGIIAAQQTGFSDYALPSAVYGVTMYLVTLPFVFWFRSRNAGELA
ncbi:MAG: bile acid:sodium symporter family protein [Pseudomonadota bacterium]